MALRNVHNEIIVFVIYYYNITSLQLLVFISWFLNEFQSKRVYEFQQSMVCKSQRISSIIILQIKLCLVQ